MAEENVQTEEQVAGGEQQAAAAEQAAGGGEQTTPYYAQFGEFDSEDAFKSWVDEAKTVVSSKSEIEKIKSDYENQLRFLGEAEVDIDPEIATLNEFKKKGITIDVATRVTSFDLEKANDNPLETLILAEAVSNPNKYTKLGRQGIEAAIREKYGLSEDGEYTPTALMKSDAIDAVEKIQTVKNSVAETKNPLKFAKEELQKRSLAFEEGKKASSQLYESVVKEISEITDTHGDQKFTYKVSEAERELAMNLKDQIAAQFPPTKEGREQMSQYVNNYLRIQKYLNGEVYKEWQNSLAADVKQQAVKEVLNGGQATAPNRSGQPNTNNEKDSPIYRQAVRDGKIPN
jgi:hypothetical protein